MKLRTLMTAAALTTGLVVTSGCTYREQLAEEGARGATVHYHPETGEMYRLYTYYPDDAVYHSVYQDKYYYQQDNQWVRTTSLPNDFELSSRSVLIELPTRKPHTMHEDVVAAHPSIADLEALLAQLEAENELIYGPADGSSSSSTFASVPGEH